MNISRQDKGIIWKLNHPGMPLNFSQVEPLVIQASKHLYSTCTEAGLRADAESAAFMTTSDE